jgi:hypothetical protein
MSLVLEIFFLALPRAIEPAFADECCDGMELTGIQKHAMPATHVDDGSRDSAKVHAVHHLFAHDAGAVMDWESS